MPVKKALDVCLANQMILASEGRVAGASVHPGLSAGAALRCLGNGAFAPCADTAIESMANKGTSSVHSTLLTATTQQQAVNHHFSACPAQPWLASATKQPLHSDHALCKSCISLSQNGASTHCPEESSSSTLTPASCQCTNALPTPLLVASLVPGCISARRGWLPQSASGRVISKGNTCAIGGC